MAYEKKKLNEYEKENSSYAEQNEYQMQKEKELENTIKMQQLTQTNGKKRNKFFVNLNKLFQDVNDDVKKNKNIALNRVKESSETIRSYQEKISKKSELLKVFQQVKLDANNYFTNKLEKESIKDFRVVLERLEEDISYLKVN